MLSAVRFLHHVFLFSQDIFIGPYRFVTDNQGLITRVQNQLTYTKSYPTSTLEPDWDVVIEIVRTLNDLPIEKSFHHVKGHQDDKIAYKNLTLDARLNVDADAEAGEYRYNNPEPRPKITRLPSNSAQLHVSGATISAHYRIEIEKAASTTNIREYIRSKNDWTTKQIAYINWDAHGKALSQLAQHHTQLVKMSHEILPTATITSRYKPTASPLCPICKAADEDRDHVMRCADSKKAKWRHQLIGTVQKGFTKMKTREMLTTILADGLMQWFNDKQIQPAAYPAPFHRLMKQQNEIG
jgi:hypothetical protein